MARETMIRDTYGNDLTITDMARTWLGQMTEEEREEIRTTGAAGWRGGVTASELAMTEEQVTELLKEMERQAKEGWLTSES